jgi:hypothetical protein
MVLAYFHFENGVTTVGTDGIELADVAAMRTEAAAFIADTLWDDEGLDTLWQGKPLQLRITDKPGGAGNTLLALQVTATCPIPPEPDNV